MWISSRCKASKDSLQILHSNCDLDGVADKLETIGSETGAHGERRGVGFSLSSLSNNDIVSDRERILAKVSLSNTSWRSTTAVTASLIALEIELEIIYKT